MFSRSILIPSLVVCAITAPILFSESNLRTQNQNPSSPYGDFNGRLGDFRANGQAFTGQQQYPGQPFQNGQTFQNGQPSSQFASYSRPNPADAVNPSVYGSPSNSPVSSQFGSRNLSGTAGSHSQAAFGDYGHSSALGAQASRPPASGHPQYGQISSPAGNATGRSLPFGLVPINVNPSDQLASAAAAEFRNAYGLTEEPTHGNEYSPMAAAPSLPPPGSSTSGFYLPVASPQSTHLSPVSSSNFAPDFAQPVNHSTSPPSSIVPMLPDYGAAETLVFPGNEFGPNLNAAPLDFVPVADFAEIFRFDITADWVKRRWSRVSTNAGDTGLRGLRVAVVTGLNSWDLHGSLTYYFDAQQRLQRITFRGWTGDPDRLVQMLTSAYEFRPQPSLLAGFYVAQKRRDPIGALLMKEPPIVSADNPREQMALILEINNPAGKMTLSDEIRLLIAGSASQ